MITIERARELAHEEIKKIDLNGKLALEKIVEFDDGWIFFFNSKAFMESHNFLDRPLGPGPIIVDKELGTIFRARPTGNIELSIKEFKEYQLTIK